MLHILLFMCDYQIVLENLFVVVSWRCSLTNELAN
jgi:hypothetical protein